MNGILLTGAGARPVSGGPTDGVGLALPEPTPGAGMALTDWTFGEGLVLPDALGGALALTFPKFV